jgi:pentatricopeptide repeat protein
VGLRERARRLGIAPNGVMVNTAMSALGKAGRPADAAALFAAHPAPDAVAHETLIAAHGLAGDASAAEAAFQAMRAAGHAPRDYAYTALVRAASWGFLGHHRGVPWYMSCTPLVRSACHAVLPLDVES